MSAVVGCRRDVFDFNFSTAISNLLQPHTTALPLAINFIIRFYYTWNRFEQFMGFCYDFDDILSTLIQSPNFSYFGFFLLYLPTVSAYNRLLYLCVGLIWAVRWKPSKSYDSYTWGQKILYVVTVAMQVDPII